MRFFKRYILLLLGAIMALTASCAHPDLDVVLLGDSNTWIGGDDCSKERGWPKWFATRFEPASIRSYARSGATWCNTADTRRSPESYSEIIDNQNVIYNQVVRLIDAANEGKQPSPEIIIIGAGANDAWFGSKRPYAFHDTAADAFRDDSKLFVDKKPSDCLSLAASIRLSAEMLMEAFPKAQIVLLTPPQITQCDYDSQCRVADVITECGRRMSLAIIHLNAAGGTYRIMERVKKTNTADGAHTTVEGARRTGNFIASQLESLILF